MAAQIEPTPVPETSSNSGASFLFSRTASVFTPEMLSTEERELFRMAEAFTKNEILAHDKRLDHKDYPLLVSLIRKAGDLGLLMVSIPEEFGGLGMGKVQQMLVYESVAQHGTWSVTFGAHTGIGTLPIVYFGTPAQKAKYLPELATGRKIAAYALSEPGSGSDALGARTTAVLSADGSHYVLNGTKQWISNAAIADVLVVFAKVDGKHFTAFIVEKGTPGFTVGPEEHKMGLRGSSTCPLIFEDARVPAENVLGQIGRGHKIAFNILNVGRLALGASAVGGSRRALALGVGYALERKQFQRPIAEFGLIRDKIARAVAMTYALESMMYRTAGLIDQSTLADPMAAAEEYAVESSILKVFGSEAVGTTIDEMLQIHGGNGYTEDYPIERMYRDARVNRIFEGTSEINRMLIPGMIFKRAMKGQVPLMESAERLDQELAGVGLLPRFEGPLAAEQRAAELVKRMFVYAARAAAMTFGPRIEERQEVLAALADVAIEAYAIDSSCARTLQHGAEPAQVAAVQLYTSEARERGYQRARVALCSTFRGDELAANIENLSKLSEFVPYDPAELREAIVAPALERRGYPFLHG